MRSQLALLAGVVVAVGLTACSSAPTPRALARDAVAAMGGPAKLQSIQTITMKGGSGTRTRLQQTVRVGDAEVPGR